MIQDLQRASATTVRESIGAKRIVFIGASYKFVHRVVRDMIIVGGFQDSRIVLLDIDPVPLKLIGDLVERIARVQKTNIVVERTADREQALKGADCVVLSITVGGIESDFRSFEVCNKWGIEVGVGDTLGPAALARNLRTLPLVVTIMEDMERLCPDAIFLNFTNPMSCVTGVAARRRSLPTYGLCHSADELMNFFSRLFGATLADVDMEVAGVNHQSFVTKLVIKGVDRTAEIGAKAMHSDEKLHDELIGVSHDIAYQREMFAMLGVWPSTGADHLAEFYPFFFIPERITEPSLHARKRLIPGRAPFGRSEAPQILKDWAYGDAGPGDLDRMTEEHAHELMWSYFTGEPYTRSLNMLNDGAIAGLPDDACVEVMAEVVGRKVTARSTVLPTAALSWVQRWAAIHDLTIAAALNCDRDAARQALMLDPHVRDMRVITPLLEDFLGALKQWMPKGWYK
ncbi:MAG TPA: hypothetical protein VEL07_22405 [Planctomycetota bacterium]|nr:hypothetical protein [Planctomycetota bacterium]